MSGSPFGSQIKRAKSLESRLESKVQRYSALAQKINADFLCDEENPLVEGSDEKVGEGSEGEIIDEQYEDIFVCVSF